MNTSVSWSAEKVADSPEEAGHDGTRRFGESRDGVFAGRIRPASPPPTAHMPDHSAEMAAIAAQLSRISGATNADASLGRSHARGDSEGSGLIRPDPRASIRDAVAQIARRQADLDGHGPSPAAPGIENRKPASPSRAVSDDGASGSPREVDASAAPRRDTAEPRRAGIDLSSEVSQTFARFSRDLQDAIQATDARPQVEALDRQLRQIGRAVNGLEAGTPPADAIDRIGQQTQEVRDLLKAASVLPLPLDSVERQVASLETRLGRLATLPVPPVADLAGTMADVRALLDGLQPRAMASLETRLDDITNRIERGLDAQGSVELIEGLGRRIDEIHASLRSQLAESAFDTRPLKDLVQGLSDRIGQTRTASDDFQQLETAMRDMATKIDGAASGVDPRSVRAVETQLARLAERLDRSEASLKALDNVEHSLGELFSQFEVTRQVAIDAAETAARTAARDTLRAALQNPSLAQRPAEMPSTFADQVARGLDDLRAAHETAERRTQTALSDIRTTMERLAPRGAVEPVDEPDVAAERRSTGSRRRGATADPGAPDASRVAIDPVDLLIEPGIGRGTAGSAGRTEAAITSEPLGEKATPAAVAIDGDGPSSFIAAARRAAQAAQASAAATAAFKVAERRPTSRNAAKRDADGAEAADIGTLTRARALLRQRRRPLLLGLAALVLLIGALEIVKIGGGSASAIRTGDSGSATPSRSHLADLSTSPAVPVPAPALPPAPAAAAGPASAPPALPLFVAGATTRPQAPFEAVSDGLRNLASNGDMGAEYELGLRYAEGRGVARDPRQAIAWFGKAAAQGSAPAQYRLGSAYEKGVGAERDPVLAMSWYGRAAEAGNIRAMHNLAVMSAEGTAGKPDYAKAAQWFGKASTFGVRDSQFNLAILYARGLGIEQSLAQSYTWFAIAAAGGDEDSAKKRDEVAAKLDPRALTDAKAVADAYRPATPPTAANEVTPPPGGWDAPASSVPALPASASSPAPGAKVSRL